MFEGKYSKFLTALLIIVIIAIIALIGFIVYDFYRKYDIDKDAQDFMAGYEEQVSSAPKIDNTVEENSVPTMIDLVNEVKTDNTTSGSGQKNIRIKVLMY